MAMQAFPNGFGTLLTPLPGFPETASVSSIGAVDAANEKFAAVGHMLLSSGPGTSKTISSSGGKVFWATAAVTWADAGTNLRVGLQDVGVTGIEDDTFDVQADLVPGTDTITASAVNSAAMESGSKTVTHGDLVAVVFRMTARGGSDSVTMLRNSSTASNPYTTLNGSKVTSHPIVSVQFDDGTVGYFAASSFAYVSETSATITVNSTPDEHALVFQVPFPCVASGVYARLSGLGTLNDFEFILYSDPLGTPNAELTIAQTQVLSAGGAVYARPFASSYALDAGVDYALALRPTATTGLAHGLVSFGTGNGDLRLATMLGTDWYYATRTNQSGAFGSADTTRLPLFGLWVSSFDDGTGSGASEVSHVFVG